MTGVVPLWILAASNALAAVPVVSPAVLPTVAVVPLAAGGERSEEEALVDEAIRRGLEGTRTARAMSAQQLELVTARARAAGIVCELRDAACVARIGAFGGFDFALVPRAQWPTPGEEGAAASLTIALVDCATGAVIREPAARMVPPSSSWGEVALALTRAALGTTPSPTSSTTDVPPPQRAMAGTQATAPRSHGGPRPLAIAGLGALGVGATVAAGGGVAAWLVAPAEQSRDQLTARQYNDAVTLGRAFLVVGAAGLALASTGALLWLLDGSDPA
ncbi:MAG: hypothetical protein IT383_00615 [Deltaproteobacteria bacterium]|nr:hypothetical protein [Deltaproteobacteria bacterium]